ncbi:hypothetical protein [Mesorhizobium caraganae]|uniref:hypothetical protein n=1 Tax=Mesorhizobium caraganae TaxID=483206 RepID=UPI003ED0C235
MSKRGIDFVEKWMAQHLPIAFTDDPAAVAADQAIKAAGKRHQLKRSAKKSAACSTFRRRCDAEPLQMISKELAADVESVPKFGYEQSPTV